MGSISQFSGKGTVYSGDVILGRTEYRLSVDKSFHEGRAQDTYYRIARPQQIRGSIETGFPLDKTLRLVTDDGHAMDFIVIDDRGVIKGSGPFWNAQGESI